MTNQLQELKNRLEAKLPDLKTLQDARLQAMTGTQARSRLNQLQSEWDRLKGKVEGVKLAISYIDEIERADDA